MIYFGINVILGKYDTEWTKPDDGEKEETKAARTTSANVAIIELLELIRYSDASKRPKLE
jgi:hypothetical protein